MRLVVATKPYPYTYYSFATARGVHRISCWMCIRRNFKVYPDTYYRHAIAAGLIQVKGKSALSYRIQSADVLCHTVHCHGPVVRVTSPHPPCVEIVAETNHVLVVSKTSNHAHSCVRMVSPKRPRSIIGAGSGRTVTTTSINTTTTNTTLIYDLSIGSLNKWIGDLCQES